MDEGTESLPGEEWRDVPGYEDSYAVSSLGRVYRKPYVVPGRIARAAPTSSGYPQVRLSNGRGRGGILRLVHVMVARAFIGDPDAGMEVRHLDGDAGNPALVNLAYGTRSENMLDTLRHGTNRNAQKTHCPQGHAYTAGNIIIKRNKGPNGARTCRACRQARSVETNRRRREARRKATRETPT